MRKTFFALFAILCSALPREVLAQPDSRPTLVIMWWNVENLFDTRNDPATADDDFTPPGLLRWSLKKLALKQMRIRQVLRAIRAHPRYLTYPDILAFAETENRQIFSETLSLLGDADYRPVYYEMHDPRGIDIGLAYRPASVQMLSSKAYRVPLQEAATRDIVVAGFAAGGHVFHIVLNHWPSRSFDAGWTEPKRVAAARMARRIVDSLLTRDRKADIIVMGDFNDEPDNLSVKNVLGSSFNRNDVRISGSGLLYNCWSASREKGSYWYRKNWERIDQIILSAGMLDRKGLSVRNDGAFHAFTFSRMLDETGSRPWPTYEKGKYRGGYSDHLPLLLKAEIEN
jgi:hypothetical protein